MEGPRPGGVASGLRRLRGAGLGSPEQSAGEWLRECVVRTASGSRALVVCGWVGCRPVRKPAPAACRSRVIGGRVRTSATVSGMAKSPMRRKRCTECRCWFLPEHRNQRRQKTCGAERCRRSRRRKVARQRRQGELWVHRDEERERQRRCRNGGRKTCHAPTSGCNNSELRKKLREVWDNASAVSRASFERSMLGILRKIMRSGGTREGPESGCHAPTGFCNHRTSLSKGSEM